MKGTYIAIDIGASSGRLMKSQIELDGTLSLEEVHRFKNGFRLSDGHDRWAINTLVEEILVGLEKVKQSGVEQCFVGIDTWAVDYCLLDQQGELLEEPISYRDKRTVGVIDRFSKEYSLTKLYQKTGIQFQPFNTIFQLYCEEQEKLAQAKQILLIPDYLGYVFTGKAVTEKTNASTTQLLNVNTQEWDQELLTLVHTTEDKFAPLVDAGTVLGQLQKDQFETYNLPDATFITVASHDTASAVIGTPGTGQEWGYISSGTWSLLGIEAEKAILSEAAFSENYTNEWGAYKTIRFLKNIMGMWLIQEVARAQDYQYSFQELADLASKEPGFQQFIDVNDPLFLNPDNMITALQTYCQKTEQKVPRTAGELARCIYDNLALCYATELEKMEQIMGQTTRLLKLHIVGGGSNNRFLNQLTANISKRVVEAGPSEATAIGNIVVQMIETGELADLEEARQKIKESFPYTVHQPEPIDEQVLENYRQFITKGA